MSDGAKVAFDLIFSRAIFLIAKSLLFQLVGRFCLLLTEQLSWMKLNWWIFGVFWTLSRFAIQLHFRSLPVSNEKYWFDLVEVCKQQTLFKEREWKSTKCISCNCSFDLNLTTKKLYKKQMNKAPTNNISSIQLLSKGSDLMHRFCWWCSWIVWVWCSLSWRRTSRTTLGMMSLNRDVANASMWSFINNKLRRNVRITNSHVIKCLIVFLLWATLKLRLINSEKDVLDYEPRRN